MSKQLWEKRRILLLGAAIAIALFLSAFIYLFSSPVDLSSQHARIEAIIENRTGMPVTAQSIVLRVFPRVDLRIKGVTAFDGTDKFLKIRSMRLVLPLLSLLSHSTIINLLDMDGLELNVIRNASGVINLERFLKEPKPVVLKNLTLSDARVSFKDEAANAAFDLTGVKASIDSTTKGFDYMAEATLEPDVKIGLRGTRDIKKDGLKFSGTCNVKGFDLARLTPYLTRILPNASISGKTGFVSTYSYDGNLRANGSLTYKNAKAILPGILAKPLVSASGAAVMSFFRDKQGTVSAIDKATLSFDDFNLFGSLKVRTLAANQGVRPPPVFVAKLSSTPIPVPTILNYLPASNNKMMEKIRPVDGTVAVEGVSVSGTSDDLKDSDAYKKPGFVSATIKLDNVKVRYQKLEKPFTGIRGVLAFKDNVLSLEHFTGRYGAINVDDLSGGIKDPARAADYNFSLSADLESSELLQLTSALLKERGAGDDFKKMDMAHLTGKAGLILKLSGQGLDFKDAAYSGNLELKGVSASYGDIPLTLKSVRGALSFNNSRLTLNGVEGTDQFKSTIIVNGPIENYLSRSPVFNNLMARGALSQGTVETVLRRWGVEGPVYAGSVPFSILLGGNPGSLNAGATLDFTPVAIEYKNIIKKAAGVTASVKAHAEVGNKKLSVREVALNFGNSSVIAGGQLSLDKERAYSLFARSSHIDVSDLSHVAAFLADDAVSGGVLAFTVFVDKNADDKKPSYKGEIMLKDSRFNAAFLAKPVEKLSTSLKFDKDAVHVTLDKLSAGQTEVSGHLDAENGHITFDMDSPGFFLEDFIKKAEGRPSDTAPGAQPEKKPDRIKNFLSGIVNSTGTTDAGPSLVGNGSIKIKKGSIMGQTFEDLSARFDLENDALYIKPIAYLKNEGRGGAEITIYRGASSPLLFTAKMEFAAVQLEPFFKETGAKKKILSGSAHGIMELTGRRGASPFSAGLNGSVYLGSEDGKLYKFMLLNKIFSIVNILSVTELFDDGLPYKFISGSFAIKDGIITTRNLRLDASSMRMSAIGEIHLPNASIDAVLAMHPFVTIDKIITTVPLAGWIIGGKQESTLSMYYDIVGPLKSPEVDPAPIKSLSAGVLGILQRLIEAPVDLLIPDSEPK